MAEARRGCSLHEMVLESHVVGNVSVRVGGFSQSVFPQLNNVHAVGRELETLSGITTSAGDSSYTCHFETSMSTLGTVKAKEKSNRIWCGYGYLCIYILTYTKYYSDPFPIHEPVENFSKVTLREWISVSQEHMTKTTSIPL